MDINNVKELIRQGDKVSVLFGIMADGTDDMITGTLLTDPGPEVVVESRIGYYYCRNFQAILRRKED